MTLNANKKVFQIIVITSALFIVVLVITIIITIVTGNKKGPSNIAPNKIVPPQANPVVPQAVGDIKAQIIKSALQNRNGDYLLYKTDNFTIQYISAPNVFFVEIAKDAQKSKEQGQKWFLDKGLKPEDLCSLSVRFVLTTKEVRQEVKDFSSLPEGCSGSPISKP